MKKYKLIFFVLSTFCCCTFKIKYDIYNFFPIKSKLDEKDIYNSSQLFVTNNYIILVSNTQSLWNKNTDNLSLNYHLFFYNKKLELQSSCYFPVSEIKRVDDFNIVAIANENSKMKSNLFRNELPNNFKINWLDTATKFKRMESISNKVILSAKYINNLSKVEFIVKSSENVYAIYNDGKDDLTNFSKLDTIITDAISTNFDFLRSKVTVIDDRNPQLNYRDELVFYDINVVKLFNKNTIQAIHSKF